METSTESGPGLAGSAKRLLNAVMAAGENRLELFLIELREERIRVFDALVLGCAVAVLGLMALLTVTVTLAVIFWDSARVTVLAGLSAFYFFAAIGAAWRLKLRLRNWASFSATLTELKKDRACLADES